MDYDNYGRLAIDPSVETLRLTDLYLATFSREDLDRLIHRRSLHPDDIKDPYLPRQVSVLRSVRQSLRMIYRTPNIKQELEHS